MKSSPELDTAARESLIFDRLQAWDKAILSRTEIGIMCREVRDGLLWKHRTTSFSEWMALAAPRARSTAHQYLREVTELSDIPDEHLAQIRGENVDTVMHLSTAVRSEPAVLEAAKSQKAEEFVETIREKHPLEHIEHRKTLKFRPVESAAAKIEEAIDVAMEHGADSREDALELLAVTAVDQWRLEYEVGRRVREACEETV